MNGASTVSGAPETRRGQCAFIRPNGERCRVSWGLTGDPPMCYNHAPGTREDSVRAKLRGALSTAQRHRGRRVANHPERERKAPAPDTGLGRYTGTILDVMDTAGLTGASWTPWRTVWKAVFALSMSDEDRAIYTRHTERETPPAAPVREVALPVGRRAGKSRNAAIAGLFLAVSFDVSTLAPGEVAVVPIISADRKQARQVLGYLKALCRLDSFAPYVGRVLKESVELKSGVLIEIHTSSFRTVRGYTVIGAVLDECAFFRTDDGSANPDSEILRALRPGMATVPGSLLLLLSSPYAARGELYGMVERYFGQDDPRVLAFCADTLSMNPTVPASEIERAWEDDPVAAASEYGRAGRVVFRRDVEAFLDVEAIRAVTVPGRLELPRVAGVAYVAFTDPSGGSRDSFTVAIAHVEGDVAVLDAVRERRAPCSPADVCMEFAELLKSYGIHEVTGDRYGGLFPRERFREHGIEYCTSERVKSDIYGELLPLVNAGRVELLDLPALRAQLMGLERRTARGGKDSIDHAPRGRDDVANSAAGALTLCGPAAEVPLVGARSEGLVQANPWQYGSVTDGWMGALRWD